MSDMYLGNESGGFDLVGTTNIKNIDFEEAKISKEDYENLSEEEKKSGIHLVTGLDDIENGGGSADLISYDNTNSGLDSTNVQGAIDELNSNLSVRYNSETDAIEVYYDGKWNEWKNGIMQALYLYNGGTIEEFDSVFESYRGTGSATEYSSYISLKFPTYSSGHTIKGTINPVTIPDDATKLRMKFNGGSSNMLFGIASSKITGTSNFVESVVPTASEISTLEIDVKDYAGMDYYVVLAGSNGVTLDLYAMWFE